jgi:hypothetical protein
VATAATLVAAAGGEEYLDGHERAFATFGGPPKSAIRRRPERVAALAPSQNHFLLAHRPPPGSPRRRSAGIGSGRWPPRAVAHGAANQTGPLDTPSPYSCGIEE